MAPIAVDKFRQVYADSVKPDLPDDEAYKQRSLHWHGKRVTLAEAAKAYAVIEEGYNEFKSFMLTDLKRAFPHSDIEVTPARECSVAVYLHIPNKPSGLLQEVERFVALNWNADEMDIVTKFTCLQDNEPELVGKALRVWWD